MIRKLQHRFIRIAVIALTIAMVLVTGIINAVNWWSVQNELNDTLSFLIEAGGTEIHGGPGGRLMGKPKHTRNVVSESKWFSVFLTADNQISIMNLNSMVDADAQLAAQLTEQVIARGQDSGQIQDYLYRMAEQSNGGRLVLFLNAETRITAVRTLALISAAACVGGILLAWLIVSLASRRAVEPTIRQIEQQKQFITNASHELKTPLTVISTNMQLLQTDMPGNPWVQSTQKQTAQMRRLVEELVYLSRMEEENAQLNPEPLALDALLRETAEPFADMAEFNGKTLTVSAEQPITIQADRASIQRLISTLLDNAVKYASDEGPILAEAAPDGRMAILRVSNAVTAPLTPDQCRQLFNRFYRADPSRSKEKQTGFGIGLSIAAAIAEKHGGTISADMEENRLVFTCRLPRK